MTNLALAGAPHMEEYRVGKACRVIDLQIRSNG